MKTLKIHDPLHKLDEHLLELGIPHRRVGTDWELDVEGPKLLTEGINKVACSCDDMGVRQHLMQLARKLSEMKWDDDDLLRELVVRGAFASKDVDPKELAVIMIDELIKEKKSLRDQMDELGRERDAAYANVNLIADAAGVPGATVRNVIECIEKMRDARRTDDDSARTESESQRGLERIYDALGIRKTSLRNVEGALDRIKLFGNKVTDETLKKLDEHSREIKELVERSKVLLAELSLIDEEVRRRGMEAHALINPWRSILSSAVLGVGAAATLLWGKSLQVPSSDSAK